MNSENLRLRRQSVRTSQHTIAKLAGISRNRLSLLECAYALPTKEELRRINSAISKVERELRKSPFLRVRKV